MPSVYVVGMRVDVSALADDEIAFVQRSLRERFADIHAVVERLIVLGKTWPALAADLLVQQGSDRRLIRLRYGAVENKSPVDLEVLARQLEWQAEPYRLPPDGYTQKRLQEVHAMDAGRSPQSIPKLIEYLRYATSGASLEQELRGAIYEALSWHDTDEVRALLLAALRDEPDDIADPIAANFWRQPSALAELPRLVDAAWRPPRDERLARRLLAALVHGDDERRHAAWVRANYPVLLQRCGARYD